MFDRLKRRLQSRADGGHPPEVVPPSPSLNEAYRLHSEADRGRFTKLAEEAFPELAGRIDCFGADWLGRQFATDKDRILAGEPQILLVEPGSGDTYQIPESFDTFHGRAILEHPDETVEFGLFGDWLASGGARPGYDQCVAYKIPLFLGGSHDVTNFELSDFDVYWGICGQLLAQIRSLPAGTPIGRVTIG